MPNSTDVIGYTADADNWCPTCAIEIYARDQVEYLGGVPTIKEGVKDHEGNDVHAMFGGEEMDYIPTCPGCLEIIPGTSLTEHGRRALAQSIQGNRERAAAALRDYSAKLKEWYNHSAQDMMDDSGQHLDDAQDNLTHHAEAVYILLDELLSATLEGKAVIVDGVLVQGMDYELCRAAKWSNPGHNCWICQL